MDLLKFIALDGEDLEVVSTHLQDAVVRSSEVLGGLKSTASSWR